MWGGRPVPGVFDSHAAPPPDLQGFLLVGWPMVEMRWWSTMLVWHHFGTLSRQCVVSTRSTTRSPDSDFPKSFIYALGGVAVHALDDVRIEVERDPNGRVTETL